MRFFVLCLTSFLFLAFACESRDDTGLTGTIQTPAGQPLSGIFVTASDTTRGIAITTFTDADGFYQFADLASGTYQVTAHQVGFKRASTLEVAFADKAQQDFQLEPEADRYSQVPSSAFLAMLPDGETKRQFILDCTGCHQLNRQVLEFEGRLKSRAEWQQRTAQMISFSGGSSGFPIMAPSRDADATADWLIAHFGDGSTALPTPTAAIPEATPDLAQTTITEYDVPNPRDLPHDLVQMEDGRLLITGMNTHEMLVLDPETGMYTSYPIPVQFANPRAVDIDANGVWWVLLGFPQQIASYNPTTEEWQAYPIGMYPHSIVLGNDGKVWFNGHFTKEPEQMGYLDPRTGDVKLYDVPTAPMEDGGSTIPYGLRAAPDGTIWGTQLVGSRLIKFDPVTEAFTLYDFPTSFSGPRRPDIAPDGTVWIPEYANNKLARFDPATEAFTEYELPVPDALPYIVRVDAQRGGVWVATASADAAFWFDITTETFTAYPLPTSRALVRHIDLDPDTGDLWLAHGHAPAFLPKIVRIQR